MKPASSLIIIILLAAIACVLQPAGQADSLGTPTDVAGIYLSAWRSGDYLAMYNLLSSRSRQYISRVEFADVHQDFARQYVIESYSITETIDLGETAIVRYELSLTGIGRLSKYQSGKLNLVQIDNRWYVDY